MQSTNINNYSHYTHIVGAVTTIVTSNSAVLNGVTVNKAGTLCTIYDGIDASGKVLASISTTVSSIGGTFTYNALCKNGIAVVTTGAGSDVTVTFQ